MVGTWSVNNPQFVACEQVFMDCGKGGKALVGGLWYIVCEQASVGSL